MAAILNSHQLLDLIIRSIRMSEWHVLVLSDRKPFHLKVFKEDGRAFPLHVFIWNCTHGGGSKRSPDEYRIQFTGVVPRIIQNEPTLLLGWHDECEVFVGWDIRKHSDQDSQSPSAQVKINAIRDASRHSFSIYRRKNDEITVAFRPQFLVEYALNSGVLHASDSGDALDDLSLLNSVDEVTDERIDDVGNNERKRVIREVVTKYRAHDFRRRVIGSYENKCAVCDIQLGLIDAAHIIPVADNSSTDETSNGIALCKIHHAAYDNNIISFDENYRIEVSDVTRRGLEHENIAGGFDDFVKGLRDCIALPLDEMDRPNPKYILRAREIRGWGRN